MNAVIEFLKENEHISVKKLETDLNIPFRTIRLDGSRSIPDKYLGQIEDYLRTNHSYTPDTVCLRQNEDNIDKPRTNERIVKMYNVDRIPSFNDNIYRFQDKNNGLWRRVEAWGYTTDKKTKLSVLKDTYEPQTDEILSDDIGEFYIANNGYKIYLSYN